MGLTHIIVVRGFIPDGLRSSPKTIQPDLSDKPSKPGLGPLRSPSGINPLTTDKYFKLCVVERSLWPSSICTTRNALPLQLLHHMGLTHIIVVRGFIPAGLRSGPKTIQPDPSDKPSKPGLGPLRSPSGINPLTTDKYFKLCVVERSLWPSSICTTRNALPLQLLHPHVTDTHYCGEGIYPRWLRSSPKTIQPDLSDKPSKPGLGPLRSPSGINPLTTDK